MTMSNVRNKMNVYWTYSLNHSPVGIRTFRRYKIDVQKLRRQQRPEKKCENVKIQIPNRVLQYKDSKTRSTAARISLGLVFKIKVP